MSKARSIAAQAGRETILPVGTVSFFPTASPPTGWLLADGAAVSRTAYAALFARIGTTYGAGNGTTTFNLPDGRGRTLIGAGQGSGLTNRALGATGGAETHTLALTEIPAHTHTTVAMNTATTGGPAGSGSSVQGFSAVTSSSAGGGGAHNNMQPFLAMSCFIYAAA